MFSGWNMFNVSVTWSSQKAEQQQQKQVRADLRGGVQPELWSESQLFLCLRRFLWTESQNFYSLCLVSCFQSLINPTVTWIDFRKTLYLIIKATASGMHYKTNDCNNSFFYSWSKSFLWVSRTNFTAPKYSYLTQGMSTESMCPVTLLIGTSWITWTESVTTTASHQSM